MSNRAKALSQEITEELRDAIDGIHDKLIHLAFLHNPKATEDSALAQANRDLVEMLQFYIDRFSPPSAESAEKG